jgi:hypothetical protein
VMAFRLLIGVCSIQDVLPQLIRSNEKGPRKL